MSSPESVDILNRLHVLLHRSLAMYLHYARPWNRPDQAEAMRTLDRIVANQSAMSDRVCTMIMELGGTIDYGHFPMTFTALHDVSFDYLLNLLIDRQERETVVIQRLVDALRLFPMGQALVQEALGEAKAHLDMLRGLQQPATAH